MGSQDWVPADINTERPSAARIYDYWLGGAHNFEADRRVAQQMLKAYPDGQRKVWANRAFLRRAVEFLVGEGVRQFLDVGSGVPTVGPVAVLAVALFHFIPDADDPAGIIAGLTDPLVSGSYLALSHGTEDGPDDTTELEELYRRAGINWTSRPYHQLATFFAGHDLVEPGLAWVPLWRPDATDDPYRDRPEHSSVYAGVGRKR